MLVDDDSDILALAVMCLEASGQFKVVSCLSGGEALDLLRKERPDLIVLDVMMPGLDGPGTLRAIRELPACGDIPVVFLTAKGLAAKQQLAGEDCCAILSKPINPLEFADQLQSVWENLPDRSVSRCL